ncbi:Protein BTG1 [Microtus ochrogaster]|uniref:Protein BTG1 n=1 Tax=Microtus ochrogaster TaxID=79684 RepID=A0A8J6GKU7_MICOH|nr:Protein BTG1 [Microtus ochrogaster]
MSCTAAAALRPSELEMQLLGSSEATELEAEAAGEVRAMSPRPLLGSPSGPLWWLVASLSRSRPRADVPGLLTSCASCLLIIGFVIEHYKHHWFPEKPCKGSGYRCIRINHKMDPLIGQAAQRIGLSSQELFRLLPSELTLWVDPYEVSYRIGEDGSICVLYEASPAGGSTPNNSSNVQMVDSRISCKEELLLGRTSPSKNYNMMTVSG